MGRVWLIVLTGAAVAAAALIEPGPCGAQATSGVSIEAVSDSVRAAEAAVSDTPEDARAYVRLGHAYLKADEGEKAMDAFRKAISLDGKLAAAYNGVGLVYLEVQKDWQLAVKYFMQALRRDRTYTEAQYNIARAQMSVGNRATRGEAERAIKMDPTYAPAYLLLAQWYQSREKYDEAIESYRKYMELRPDDQEVGYDVGLSLLMRGRYDEAESFAMQILNAAPRYAVLAQVMMHRRDYERALQAFTFYLDYLPPEDRALYEDISLVASPEDLAAYRKLPERKRPDFLRRFWLQHDPSLVDGGARRRAEHYRRVWHARTYFSKHTQPWDRRGEVYIRYGEPDYRSTSRNMNFAVPPAVRQVQEQLAREIYGPDAAGVQFYGPVFPIRTDKTAELDVTQVEDDEYITQRVEGGVALDDTLGLARYRPVTSGFQAGMVPWEVWVYTGIGGGLEVVFTDETLNGSFDYAPMPTPTAEDYSTIREEGRLSSMLRRFERYTPEAVVRRATSHLPERYDVTQGVEPIDFIYDTADFQAPDGGAEVEVYTGIPMRQFLPPGAPDTVLTLVRTVALVDSSYGRLYRARDAIRIRTTGEGVALDQTALKVPPGAYEMGVEIRLRGTTRMQIYRHRVEVEAYPEGELRLSDIQAAREVSPEPPSGARFVKEGLQVVPAPGRTFFTGKPVTLYFEIYGLRRDEFGATRYEVSHSVRAKQGQPLAVRALSGLGRLLGGGEGEQEVTIRYEQTGTESRVVDYVALDLSDAEPGEYRVRVSVRDVLADAEVVKERSFRLVGR